MQLLPSHNLKKHPYTHYNSQITTSKDTHIHTTTYRSQPQRYSVEEYKHKKSGDKPSFGLSPLILFLSINHED